MHKLYNKMFVLLVASFLHYSQMSAVTMRQANILLTVKNLFCTGDIDDQRLSMTKSYCGYNGVQPIEFIVKNESDVPVRISAQSLRASRISKEQLVILDSREDLVGGSILAGFCLGLPLLIWEGKAVTDNNVVAFHRHFRVPRYVNGQYPPFCIATMSWIMITAAAFTIAWCHRGDNNNNVRQLAKVMLADEIVIQPGQTVRKIAFLDAQYYNGLFTFQVLSDDRKQYVASFDVELFD